MLTNFSYSFRVFFYFTLGWVLLFSCKVDDGEAIDPATLNVWENFTTSNGLPDNFVRSLFEDSQGNIWIGTLNNGVSRYDGKNFTNFNTSDGLVDNSILSIAEDDDGVMWFGTFGGLGLYDGSNWFLLSELAGIPFNGWALLNDNSGNMWIGTKELGLLAFDGSTFLQFFDNNCIECNFINTFYLDQGGDLWIGTEGGAKRFDGTNFTLFNTSNGLADNDVQSFNEDTFGNLWIGTLNSDRVTRYDGSSFESVSLSNGKTQNWVSSIVIDNEENVWFGTVANGLVVYNGAFMRTIYESADGLPDNTIVAMLKDSQTNIWVGTTEGGVSRFISK